MTELKVSDGIKIIVDDFHSIIALMSESQKVELIESLSCEDAVIKHVIDQVTHLHGCTENGFSGSHTCSAAAYAGGGSELDKAKFIIAKSSGSLAREMISAQARQIELLIKQNDELTKKINFR